MRADGSHQVRLLKTERRVGALAWSPNGQRIAFTTGEFNGGNSTVTVVRKDGTGLTDLREDAEDPAFSPEGKR
jgi:dipeptidyl aminopeptidase/acylaminoacyl peptidase